MILHYKFPRDTSSAIVESYRPQGARWTCVRLVPDACILRWIQEATEKMGSSRWLAMAPLGEQSVSGPRTAPAAATTHVGSHTLPTGREQLQA